MVCRAAKPAGQDEDGTLALAAVLAIRRRTILLQKAAAMALQAILLAAAVTICVIIGRGFQRAVSPANTIAISAALVLMGLDFGLATMAVGAITGRRGTALDIGSGLAAALASAQLTGIDDIGSPAPVAVTVPLVGRQPPDRPESQRGRLHRLDRDRPRCPARRGCRVPEG